MNYFALQEECFEANRKLPKTGLVDLTFGNVSVLDRKRGVFAIKPSGIDYKSLRPKDMVLVDLDGKQVAGKLRPSSDAPTHRYLFRSFAEARAIVHTHSRNAVAFAQAGLPIPCIGTTHADYFPDAIPVTRALTSEEIQSDYEWNTGLVIEECFRLVDPQVMRAVLVRGHGPFAWGNSGAEAVENALALEIIADLASKSMALKAHCPSLPEELILKHFNRKHGPDSYYGQKRNSASG